MIQHMLLSLQCSSAFALELRNNYSVFQLLPLSQNIQKQ